MQYINTAINTQGILEIFLARPDKLNALNSAVLSALDNIIKDAQSNSAIKALLITGEGKAFCAGADIHALAELNSQQGFEFAQYGQQIFRQLEELGKPSLAAINGFAFGGGCELAMAATIRIAATTAQFGQPEIKLGVIPGYGGTQRLARLIGKGRALELCLTGRFINAETALSYGLISEITTAENLISRSKEILLTIVNMAPLAVASLIQVIDRGYNMTLEDALHLEAAHFGLLCGSEDKKIGTTAFLNKQAAKFSGQ